MKTKKTLHYLRILVILLYKKFAIFSTPASAICQALLYLNIAILGLYFIIFYFRFRQYFRYFCITFTFIYVLFFLWLLLNFFALALLLLSLRKFSYFVLSFMQSPQVTHICCYRSKKTLLNWHPHRGKFKAITLDFLRRFCFCYIRFKVELN